MSLRKTGLVGRYSASAAASLTYASFAMTTVLLRTYPAPQPSRARALDVGTDRT